MPDEFDDEYTAVTPTPVDERIDGVSRIATNARMVADDSLSKVKAANTKLENIEATLTSLKTQIELVETLKNQLASAQSEATTQANTIEQLKRQLDQATNRLDGKSQYGVGEGTSYEKAVSTLSNLVDRLSGGQEGQISYEAVRGSIQKTQFLGQVLYGAIGVFGVGAVIAAGRTFLGGPEDLSPAVQLIQKQVEANTDNISRLDSRVTADERVEQKRRIEVLENRLFEKRIKD